MLMYYIELIRQTKELISEKKYNETICKLDDMYTLMREYRNYEYVDFYLDYTGKKDKSKAFSLMLCFAKLVF